MSHFVVLLARFGQRCFAAGLPLLPKLVSLFIRLVFSCQVSPGARLGAGTVLSYGGLGVVIHGSCVLGERVNVGTHVTLGGNFPRQGVPVVGNDVFIGTGAKILGPVTIGDGAVIGANSVVLADVPPRTVWVGAPARQIRALD